MNIGELIEKLKEFDPNLPVLLAYEDYGVMVLHEPHEIILMTTLPAHYMEQKYELNSTKLPGVYIR